MSDHQQEGGTEGLDDALPPGQVRSFRISVVAGIDQGRIWDSSSAERCSIGTHESNDLVLTDSAVSRFHCELFIDSQGFRVRDLDSKNGTAVDGLRIVDAYLKNGSQIVLGRTGLRLELGHAISAVPLSEHTRFGGLVGCSPAMRALFAMLERAAGSDASVLLEGETGTGKEGAALGLHQASGRSDGPFVVVDCGALPGELLESELFGHERGAFTGAEATRIGAFEAADGGTLFLDEVGELPLHLQPKLLGALERRAVRRVGSSVTSPVDVRIIAATHRDLRLAVNQGTFRPDLFFRLAVVRITLPPLRQRPEDLPLLVDHFLERLEAPASAAERLRRPEFLAGLRASTWPGNVRELRNHIERCLVLDEVPPFAASAPGERFAIDPRLSYAEARRRVLSEFERRYLQALLELHGGNKSKAAREAGMARAHMYLILRRAGLI
jgi:two-component system, NtrC family, response regulator GlrR